MKFMLSIVNFIKRLLGWGIPQASVTGGPPVVASVTQASKNSDCVILVPYSNRIEHEVDTSLRILEARGYEVWRTPGYSAIDQGRCRMAYDALYRRGFKELMWIDSDVAFNPDDFERLRAHGLPLVAAAYPFKGYPRMTIQALSDQEIRFGEGGGLIEIAAAATGFLYTRSEVYEAMRVHFNLQLCNTAFDNPMYPFFLPAVWEEGGDKLYLGEDFSFCRRARACGFKVMLDASIKLKHIGLRGYSWDDFTPPTSVAGLRYRPEVVGSTGQLPS